ncbi:TPA: Tn3 family transposase [Salmonella enterica subsp. enterica serovar Typhimurium]|nr:Tn3 family transposase [Escherichia coli]MCV7990010.1 Tn3 family transposase [Escherichia coli]MCV8258884.1 Tn3 family transposase [Escherichia coli]HDN1292033.1 Tn3 family transposase [Escherichia coli]
MFSHNCCVDQLNLHPINDQLLSHLSPLGWEHINLNGDYVWRNNLKLGTGKYRPLRNVDIESYKKQS